MRGATRNRNLTGSLLQPTLVSRPTADRPGERAFLIAPLAADRFQGNAHRYGGLVSGATYIEGDPIGLEGGSYSTYAYVDGDPNDLIDPMGLMGFGGGGSAGAGARYVYRPPGSPPISLQIPANIGVSLTVPAGRIGSVPTVLSFRYKRTPNGSSCTVGYGVGGGSSASIRFADTILGQTTGNPTGWGLTFSGSVPLIGPVGASGSSTYFLNGANSWSVGPATVGGASVSATFGYTVNW
jgi:hypothetical protein